MRHSAADLANMLIIEAVPLAVAEGFDAGVVVAARSTPAVNHDGEELKGQQALRKHTGEEIIAQTKAESNSHGVVSSQLASAANSTPSKLCHERYDSLAQKGGKKPSRRECKM